MGLTEEQTRKVRSDLLITQENMALFNEMLTELKPGQEHPEDRSLLDQLHMTCKDMQARVLELIEQVEDDKLTADLLEVNDDMNNLFLRFERHVKNRTDPRDPKPFARPAEKTAAAATKAASPPLIDFSSADAEPTPSIVNMKDEDARNIANWIEEKDESTTSEFDKFLAERAAAGDSLRKVK